MNTDMHILVNIINNLAENLCTLVQWLNFHTVLVLIPQQAITVIYRCLVTVCLCKVTGMVVGRWLLE